MIRKFALLALLAACTPPVAPPPVAPHPVAEAGTTRYLCADGAIIPVLQGSDGNIRITVKGENFNLIAEKAASGARYGWPSDGSNYVWWSKGREGTLSWKDGTKGGAETILHSGCKEP